MNDFVWLVQYAERKNKWHTIVNVLGSPVVESKNEALKIAKEVKADRKKPVRLLRLDAWAEYL